MCVCVFVCLVTSILFNIDANKHHLIQESETTVMFV